MKKTAVFLSLILILIMAGPAFAEPAYPTVSTPEELMNIGELWECVLTADIDMSGYDWTPIDYSGVLHGDGHTIYNLHIVGTGEEVLTSYDGNFKEYDTKSAGMFGVLKGTVENLNLVNVTADIDMQFGEESATTGLMLGAVAGFMDNGDIKNCSVQGRLSLRTNAKMLGVGGFAGYGYGRIENSSADTELICIDTDKEVRDEQFMGGAYSAGYIDLTGCNVNVRGFDSDHGYVHDGGLVGMYIVYPKGYSYAGHIVNNHVSGKITFFEDNRDRRAYCAPYIGEVMHWTYEWGGCSEEFIRDEVFDYSKDLLPCYDEPSAYSVTITEPGYENMGYTDYKCPACGYSYRADYKLPLDKVIETIPGDNALFTMKAELESQRAEAKKASTIKAIAGTAIGGVILLSAIIIYSKLSKKKENE